MNRFGCEQSSYSHDGRRRGIRRAGGCRGWNRGWDGVVVEAGPDQLYDGSVVVIALCLSKLCGTRVIMNIVMVAVMISCGLEKVGVWQVLKTFVPFESVNLEARTPLQKVNKSHVVKLKGYLW